MHYTYTPRENTYKIILFKRCLYKCIWRFISCKCRCYIMTTRMYQGFSYMVVRGYPRVNKSRGQGRGVGG